MLEMGRAGSHSTKIVLSFGGFGGGQVKTGGDVADEDAGPSSGSLSGSEDEDHENSEEEQSSYRIEYIDHPEDEEQQDDCEEGQVLLDEDDEEA